MSLMLCMVAAAGLWSAQAAAPATPAGAMAAHVTEPASAPVPFSVAEQAWLRQHPVLLVGSVRGGWPPYEIDRNGSLSGLSLDYLQSLIQRLGVTYRIRRYPDWPALMEAACAGEVDLVMSVSITAGRTRCLSFTQPYQSVRPALVGRRGDAERLLDNPVPFRIAVESGHLLDGVLQEAYPGAQVIALPDLSAALQAVATRRADAYFGNPYVVASELKQRPQPALTVIGPARLAAHTLHFATPNNRALLATALDRAMTHLPLQTRAHIDLRWLDPQFAWASDAPLLGREQRAWLQALPVLRVAFDPNWAPLTSRGSDGQMTGILGDYLQRMQDQLGLRLQAVPVHDWRHARALIASGQADIAPAVDDAGYGAQWHITRPLVSFPSVIVTRRGSDTVASLEDLADNRIAVSDPDLGQRLQQRLPGATRVGVGNDADGLRLVVNGGADAYVGNLASVDNALRDHHYDTLHVAAPAGFSDHIGLAVRDPYAPLVPMFDRISAAMGEDTRQQIRKRWLKVDYDYGFARPVVFWGIAAALMIIALLVAAYLRLRAEIARRREADARLREISRNLPAVVFKLRRSRDGTYEFTYVTGNPVPLFGLGVQQILRNPWSLLERIAPADREPLQAAVEESARELTPLAHDFHAEGDRGMRWLSLHGVPRRTDDGATHWSGYWVDSTALHEQNEAIEQARATAEAAAIAKSNFLAVMSHEIRTPMAGLSGLLELLGRTPLNAAQRQLLSTSVESAAALRQILDDVLDFSKAEAGEMHLETIDVDMRQIACGVLEVFAPQARQKGLELRLSMAPSLAAIHVGDPFRLRQVLLNLVGNAVKFTDAGHVDLAIETDDHGTRAQDASMQWVRMRVADTGCGISAEQQAQLFRPFVQADATTTRRYGGTGLGLMICHQLVALMDGKLQLDSEPGLGTHLTVVVRLPIKQREAARTRLSGHRARLDITNATLRATVQTLLDGWDMERDVPEGKLPDVWITDTLPVALPPQRTVLLQPLTASVPPALHHVPDDPLLPSTLRYALQAIVDAHTPGRPPAPQPQPMAQATRDIAPLLVVEDHPTNQLLIGLQLRELGYPYVIARDGEVALALLERLRPSLILTDISMPHVDGHTLARRIRQGEPAGERVPIIAMTANVLDERHLDNGAGDLDAQIHKPIDLAQLARMLARWLPVDVAPTPVPPAWETGTNAALQRLRERLGAELPCLLRTFLDSTVTDRTALEAAVAAEDAEEASKRIHRIAGALGYFGYVDAATTGRDLSEALLHAPLRQHRAACVLFLDELQRICSELAAELDGAALR